MRGEPIRERLAVDELHHEVQRPIRLTGVEDRHGVGMDETRRRPGLLEEPLASGGIAMPHCFRVDELHRDGPVEHPVACGEDAPVATDSDQLAELVPARDDVWHTHKVRAQTQWRTGHPRAMMSRMPNPEHCRRFRELHVREQIFVMPNPWDVGSARLLASLGFEALATTSAGLAWSLGKHDQQVTRSELVEHVRTIAAATSLPLNVDSERCFAEDTRGIAETVGLLAEAGAAGLSIEDYNPAAKAIDELSLAAERVEAAARAAHARPEPMVLTARAENHLYGAGDLDDTIARLVAYRDAGADAVYVPGLSSLDDIRRVVAEVGLPVNVLALPSGPSVADLASLGVRRVSTGGALARAAYGALVAGARELLEAGTSTYAGTGVAHRDLRAAFG